MKKLFCFGLGFLGRTLARRLIAQGWAVASTVTSKDDIKALADDGIEAHLFTDRSPLAHPAKVLGGVSHLLTTIRPIPSPDNKTVDPVLRLHGTDIAAMAETCLWAGYTSATGIYGDSGGTWIDETAAPNPLSEKAKARAMAESEWQTLSHGSGLPLHIFRLAGIYGPGRSALSSLRQGMARRIHKPDHVLSRVHVEDAAAVLAASMARPNPGAIYNVVDDTPTPQPEPIEFAAKLLGLDPPPLEAADTLDPSAKRSRYFRECRRLKNDRIKRELGVTLAYPSYREGLQAIFDAAAY